MTPQTYQMTLWRGPTPRLETRDLDLLPTEQLQQQHAVAFLLILV